MAVWGIADLHLSFETDKPMDVFGDKWKNYTQKLKKSWEERVAMEDLVIIPGDVSWAMNLEETRKDFAWLDALPGTKVMVKGNHDYWWSTVKKVREALPPSIYVLQNDHLEWNGWAVCGTRGWTCPAEGGFEESRDEKIYLREQQRLEFSLQSARAAGFESIIAALHYPPFNSCREDSVFTRLLSAYGVKYCLYGHLHGEALHLAFEGEMQGVKYLFVSADALEFSPALVVSENG